MSFWNGMIPVFGVIGFYIGMRIHDYVDARRMAKIIQESDRRFQKEEEERIKRGEELPSHFPSMEDFHIQTFNPPSRIIRL